MGKRLGCKKQGSFLKTIFGTYCSSFIKKYEEEEYSWTTLQSRLSHITYHLRLSILEAKKGGRRYFNDQLSDSSTRHCLSFLTHISSRIKLSHVLITQ